LRGLGIRAAEVESLSWRVLKAEGKHG